MWESLACSFGGQCLIAVIITLNGRSGAVYHVGFPILNRAAFGVYGAWWPTFNRAVMAIVRLQYLPSIFCRSDIWFLGMERCQRRPRRTMCLCDAARDISQHCTHQEQHGSRLGSDKRWDDWLHCFLDRDMFFPGHTCPEDAESCLCQAGRVHHLSHGNARLDGLQSWWVGTNSTSRLDGSWK